MFATMLSDQAIIAKLRDHAYAQQTIRLTPQTALRLAAALHAVIGMDRARPRPSAPVSDDLGYAVETWGRDGQRMERVLARASTYTLARGAYDAACQLYGHELVMMRQGTRLVARSDEKET